MTSLIPPGAAGGDPKGPVREPLQADETDAARHGPLPPSERGDREPERPPGVGLFRLAGWGLGVTIAVALFIGVLLLVGYLRDDPGRNPAPAAYRVAICTAAEELAMATEALAAGVADRDDREARAASVAEVETRVASANDAIDGLPPWNPGRSLDELIGGQIIALTNGAGALESGPVEEDLASAQAQRAEVSRQLSDGRYGFTCAG